jgi:hypothetical protein
MCFVRWQKRESQSRYAKRSPRCKAILVEAVRINGQPRQRHIAFLASYKVDTIDQPGTRSLFWQRALSRLDQLDDRISPGTRKKIEAELARHVPAAPELTPAAFNAGRDQPL